MDARNNRGGNNRGGTQRGGTQRGGTRHGGNRRGGTQRGGTQRGGTRHGSTRRGSTQRKTGGSAISEFGPALFLLLVIIFFPLLDFFGCAVDYCMASYINFATCRELAVRTQSDGASGTVANDVWSSLSQNGGGIVAFLGIKKSDVQTIVNYPSHQKGQPAIVTCQTKVTTNPFISVPWPFGTVVGLNAPITFEISSERTREVTQ